MRVRKKVVELEAEQWQPGKKMKDVSEQSYSNAHSAKDQMVGWIMNARRMLVPIKAGDWVLTEASGVHHVATNEEFLRDYEQVLAPLRIVTDSEQLELPFE